MRKSGCLHRLYFSGQRRIIERAHLEFGLKRNKDYSCRLTFPDVIAREETLAADLAAIEADMGLEPKPLPDDPFRPCFTLAEVYTDQMDKLARDAYARDYQMFGFGDWG